MPSEETFGRARQWDRETRAERSDFEMIREVMLKHYLLGLAVRALQRQRLAKRWARDVHRTVVSVVGRACALSKLL